MQEMRRADGAGGEDDLAAACAPRPGVLPTPSRLAARRLAPPHRDGATALELEAGDEASGFEPQVGARQSRLEKAARRRPPPAALLVDVEIARALVVAGVEIADRLDARLGGGGAKRIEQRPAHPRRLDPPFAARAVAVARPEEMILDGA